LSSWTQPFCSVLPCGPPPSESSLCPFCLSAFAVTVLAQSPTSQSSASLPTQGVQLGYDVYIRFPAAVSQCEPVLIYHDTPEGYTLSIYTRTPSDTPTLIRLHLPYGIGYLEWICNIPAGYTVIVEGYYDYVLVVQPGPSSCLGDITTTYAYASYATASYRSFTGNPPNTTVPIITPSNTARVTATFRTGQFTTITANPDLAVASVTKSSTQRPSTTSTQRSTSTQLLTSTQSKSRTAVIMGAVGGVAGVVILTLVIALVWTCRRCRRLSVNVANLPVAHQSLTISHAPYAV